MKITIDGTAGSGKGMMAKMIADALGGVCFDTGYMYRSVARFVSNPDDVAAILLTLRVMRFSLNERIQLETYMDAPVRQLAFDEQSLYTEENASIASRISVHGMFRAAMVDAQRKLAETVPLVVVDGRDAGTAIFPDAAIKVFLYCDANIAGQRRAEQLHQPEQANVFADQINIRNQREMTRAISPLQPAPGALIVDTSFLAQSVVYGMVLAYVRAQQNRLANWECYKTRIL